MKKKKCWCDSVFTKKKRKWNQSRIIVWKTTWCTWQRTGVCSANTKIRSRVTDRKLKMKSTLDKYLYILYTTICNAFESKQVKGVKINFFFMCQMNYSYVRNFRTPKRYLVEVQAIMNAASDSTVCHFWFLTWCMTNKVVSEHEVTTKKFSPKTVN